MQTATQPTVSPVRFIASAAGRTAPVPARHDCASCHMRELCLPAELTGEEIEKIDGLMFARRRVKMGQTLYREGEKFGFIYAVRTGTFKSVITLRDGREQVTGFQMGGDIMGLDGLARGMHATAAVALEDGEICAIPYHQLEELASRNINLQGAVRRLMAREIVREHELMMMLGSMNAEERVAAFLLNISERMKARRYSPSEFHLRMSRAEIGSYLGMKLETVSRTFSAFQDQRMLEVNKKHIRILDLDMLSRHCEARVH